MLRAARIVNPEELKDGDLRVRLLSGRTLKTLDFAIFLDDEEAGLLIYEDWGYPESLIFEIYVLKTARKRGVATWALSYAEQVATELGRTSIGLNVRSLDPHEINDEDLTRWYERKGYVQKTEVGAMNKRLSSTS